MQTLSDRISVGVANNKQSHQQIKQYLKEFKRFGDPMRIGFKLGNNQSAQMPTEYYN